MILAVSLELNKPAIEYAPLYAYLKGLGAWSHYMAPTWFVVTDKTPDNVVSGISPHLGTTDRCFVVVVERYQGWLPAKAWEWFDQHKQQ